MLILEYFINGFKENIQIIDSFLKNSSYKFVNTDDGYSIEENKITYLFFEKNDSSIIENVKLHTQNHGHLPLLFTEIYRHIDYVDFEGFFPDWKKENYFNPLIDPLVLLPSRYLLDIWEMNNKPNYLGFGPDALAKDNTSGSGLLYGVFFSNVKTIDTKIANYHNEDVFFSDYIRNCFEWGGFAGLEFEKIPENDDIFLLIKKIKKEMIEI